MGTIKYAVLTIFAACVFSTMAGAKDMSRLTPVELNRSSEGYLWMTCDFDPWIENAEYVVLDGTNRGSPGNAARASLDVYAVEVFAGGRWCVLPDDRICGTGLGVNHFVPEVRQQLGFIVGSFDKLRKTIDVGSDKALEILIRVTIAYDAVIDHGNSRKIERHRATSALTYARLDAQHLYKAVPTLYTYSSEAECRKFLADCVEQLDPPAQREKEPTSKPASGLAKP